MFRSDGPVRLPKFSQVMKLKTVHCRNGGHVCPNIYNEYAMLKKIVGITAAIDILRYRLAHIKAIISVAEEENLCKASQARVVDDYDAYMHPDLLKKAKEDLERFLNESPDDIREGFGVVDGESLEVGRPCRR